VRIGKAMGNPCEFIDLGGLVEFFHGRCSWLAAIRGYLVEGGMVWLAQNTLHGNDRRPNRAKFDS
jgi:hypothetical protein